MRLFPGIPVRGDRFPQFLIEPRGDSLTVIHHHCAYFGDPDTLDKYVSALEVFCVFAIVLNEPAHILNHVAGIIDDTEEVSFANVSAGRAADINLPLAAFDSN